MFFTKFGDLTGYAGGFTPGQLWFILYLFIISVIALPVIILYKKSELKVNFGRLNLLTLLPLFIIPMVMSPILDISGKSLGAFFAFFIIGYLILSIDNIQNSLKKYSKHLCFVFIIYAIALLFLSYGLPLSISGILIDILYGFFAWLGILSFLGIAKKHLNFHNTWTDYFTNASYPIFIFHQTWIVAVAYYVFLLTSSILLQVIIIISVSFILTILTYELMKRFKLTRFLFGIKE